MIVYDSGAFNTNRPVRYAIKNTKLVKITDIKNCDRTQRQHTKCEGDCVVLKEVIVLMISNIFLKNSKGK